jgi:hypothetical protein
MSGVTSVSALGRSVPLVFHEGRQRRNDRVQFDLGRTTPYEQSISTPVVVPGMSGVTSIHTTICDQSFFVKAQ